MVLVSDRGKIYGRLGRFTLSGIRFKSDPLSWYIVRTNRLHLSGYNSHGYDPKACRAWITPPNYWPALCSSGGGAV